MRRKLKSLAAVSFIILMVSFVGFLGLVRIQPEKTINETIKPLGIQNTTVDLNKPVIDLSGWQIPSTINYDIMAKQIVGAVIRVEGTPGKEDGSAKADGEDKAYKTHIIELQKRNVPVAVYAYVTGKTNAEMKQQARNFYEHAKAYHPTYYWLDVEETNMTNMNGGIEAFRSEMVSLGAKKIGIYAQDWFITQNKINTSKFDAIWMADYGRNTGTWDASPKTDLNYAMQQYTSRGIIGGYAGEVDLNTIRSQIEYHKLFSGKG
ncbi:glycoside hydrolase family 25 protein [Lactococcus fujiensis]|nr:glycoside hydrolase family 25 protein [Lactococcus fujiensis]